MLKVFLAGWLIVVSAYDLGQLRIPNWLVALGAAAAAFGLSTESLSFQPQGWWIAAGVAAAVAALLPAYIYNIMGAADVKLGVVLALWFSMSCLGAIWLIGSLLCGLHALALLALPHLRQRLLEAGMPGAAHLPGATARKRQIPYGAHLAIGALATMAVAS